MSAFSNIVRATSDRNFGGTNFHQVAEPYITGYHFSSWIFYGNGEPEFYTKAQSMESFNSESEGVFDGVTVSNIFQDTCLAITAPGGTLNKTEIQGLGGTKWSAPTSVDYETQLSVKFLEMTGLPIFKIIHQWCQWIRSNKSGLSAMTGTDYNKSNYAATVFYWTTKPDGRTVEFASCYSGVFPLKDPQDLFSGDLSSIDKLELDIPFNVDFIYQDKWVYTKCQNLANNVDSAIESNREVEDGTLTDLSFH